MKRVRRNGWHGSLWKHYYILSTDIWKLLEYKYRVCVSESYLVPGDIVDEESWQVLAGEEMPAVWPAWPRSPGRAPRGGPPPPPRATPTPTWRGLKIGRAWAGGASLSLRASISSVECGSWEGGRWRDENWYQWKLIKLENSPRYEPPPTLSLTGTQTSWGAIDIEKVRV